jgi:hypothetical protein
MFLDLQKQDLALPPRKVDIVKRGEEGCSKERAPPCCCCALRRKKVNKKRAILLR